MSRPAKKTTAPHLLALLFFATANLNVAIAQTLSEIPYYSLYKEVDVRRLFYGNEEIGSTVWLKRASNNVKAQYIATGQVFQRYSALNEKVILVCEGAFTDDTGTPHGLTIDNGRIVNRDLSNEMDGLVIVYATGGVVVSDLAREQLHLNNEKSGLNIYNSDQKTYFINWAQQNNATVFQTQLLASTAGLRLAVGKAQKENRERRFLAIIRNGDEVTHVVIDVPRAFYLGTLAKLVYDYLSSKSQVVGLLNLDTGDYNILQVNNSDGKALTYPSGKVSLSKATNLLVYYYDN